MMTKMIKGWLLSIFNKTSNLKFTFFKIVKEKWIKIMKVLAKPWQQSANKTRTDFFKFIYYLFLIATSTI